MRDFYLNNDCINQVNCFLYSHNKFSSGKKMKKYISLLIILICFNTYPQEGWLWQNPIPTSNTIYSINFLNDSTVFGVGDGGFMMKSTNAGVTWESINTETTLFLRDICFIDDYNFIATGYRGTVIKSSDGGTTWQIVNNVDPVADILEDIFFINTDIGWISGSSTSSIGTILKTTDGGNMWEAIITGFHSHLTSIYFFDFNSGLVIDYSGLYKSTNGGMDWNTISTGYSGFLKMLFISQSTGFIVGYNGLIIKTTDGGNTWEQKYSSNNVTLRAIDFRDENYGIAVGINGVILITSDGGESWNNISNQSYNFDDLYTVNINDDGTALSGGNRGELIKSSNNGNNWNRIRQGYLNTLNSIYMLNEEIGWVVGDGGIILKTTNGGDNWMKADSLTNKNLRDVWFISDSIGWVVGDSGSSYKTSNGGMAWETEPQFENIDINSIFFVNNNKGWVAGSNGSIYYTTNSGNSWTIQNTNTTNELISIFFTDENNGWCIKGGYLPLLKTTNSGNFWESVIGPSLVYSIYFADSNSGCAVGWATVYPGYLDFGQVYRTTDSGISWQHYPYGYGYEWGYRFFDVHLLDSNRGWIFGRILTTWGHREGIIAYTTDGGENLIFQRSSTANPLLSSSFIGESKIWVVGENGTILKNDSVNIITNKNGIKTEVISNYFLSQNYPNPFNPSTKIKFEIPDQNRNDNAIVTLKIYDILGREIATLVNEEKPAGEYEVEFDGSNLTSGVYFYQLKAGSFVETRKMVLIK
jgi:photosystem II stability/assembly factor-like uncharacterized protein